MRNFFYATLGVHTEVPHFETSNLLHLRCYHCPMAFLWAALEAEQHRRTPHSQINSVVQSCLCLRRREMFGIDIHKSGEVSSTHRVGPGLGIAEVFEEAIIARSAKRCAGEEDVITVM